MNTTLFVRRVLATLLGFSLLVPVFAFAETGIDAALNTAATVKAQTGGVKASVSASTTISVTVMTRAKNKADQEIDRRVKALTDLSGRIQGMAKINTDIKTSITTNIQNQISLLTTLKTKIDADTDGATLKADIQSITQGYRVFVLLMPQARIAAAADREATIISMLSQLGAKLQARLQAAAQAGADITVLNAALVDMGTKLGSAQTHAQTAVVSTATLTPDNGDKTKMQANEAALKSARTEIQAGHQDLVAVRKDAETIIKGLRTLKVNTTASSSVQTP